MEIFNFLTAEVTQADIASFAADKVNLKSEHAKLYREQVRNLREHLERYISEHPDIGLVKMLLSGSLAKGTALRTINDVDVAMYVKGDSVPHELSKLLDWLAERLRKTYPNIPANRIYIDGPTVVISFSGTGINVDIAPILYHGDPQWKGYLWDRFTGDRVLTSIPLHLDFIRKRKDKQPTHFSQVIRLLKWWTKQRESDTPGFKLRSFLIELIVAKICDQGRAFDDYHTSIEHFFQYIQLTGLKERIAFTDNYDSSSLPRQTAGVVEIFDPVNPENNVAFDTTEAARKQLVDLSDQALDALSYAKTCQTKGESVEIWKEVMGSTFSA